MNPFLLPTFPNVLNSLTPPEKSWSSNLGGSFEYVRINRGHQGTFGPCGKIFAVRGKMEKSENCHSCVIKMKVAVIGIKKIVGSFLGSLEVRHFFVNRLENLI